MGRQLVFDLALPEPAYTRADFVLAPGNREALAWIDRWPDWPAPVLALSGPPGCGKTHLAHVWAKRSGAALLTGADLQGKDVPDLVALVDRTKAVVVEDARAAPERALFHLYNLLREQGGHLLLTSGEPPAHWQIALPDLASRLRAGGAVALAPPDDDLLGSIILKQLADRQLHAGPGVVQYLTSRMERSGDAARLVVAALDRRALAEGREIDRRLAADVLDEIEARKGEG